MTAASLFFFPSNPAKLEKLIHTRVLTVSEVGSALMTALRRDSNGACYGIFPDAPLMDIPEPNQATFGAFVVAAKARMGEHSFLSKMLYMY